jgi:hypothetical protein
MLEMARMYCNYADTNLITHHRIADISRLPSLSVLLTLEKTLRPSLGLPVVPVHGEYLLVS